MASKTLSDVPEEGDSYPSGLSIDSRSPYSHAHTTGSSSTFHGGDRGDRGSVSSLSNISINPPRSPGPNGPRRPSSRVHPGGEAASVRSEQLRDVSSSSSLRKQALESNGARNGKDTDASSLADGVGASAGSKKEREATSGKSGRTTSSSSKRGVTSSQSIARFPGAQPGDRHYRSTPKLPNDPDAPEAPATALYWSPLPVHGVIPNKGLRAHTVNIIDSVAWVFGGCDERGCWAEVWCLDVGVCCVHRHGPYLAYAHYTVG
jgi:Rab9 effector protein with kelch motifs